MMSRPRLPISLRTVQVSISVPRVVVDRVDLLATASGQTRSKIMTELLIEGLPKGSDDMVVSRLQFDDKPEPRKPGRRAAPKVHAPKFIPRRGRPRAGSTMRFGLAACECGWRSENEASERAALRNAATHVRLATEKAQSA